MVCGDVAVSGAGCVVTASKRWLLHSNFALAGYLTSRYFPGVLKHGCMFWCKAARQGVTQSATEADDASKFLAFLGGAC